MLTILKVELLQAKEEMVCDASTYLIEQFINSWDEETSCRHIKAVFNARHKKIKAGEQYFSYVLHRVELDAFPVNQILYTNHLFNVGDTLSNCR